MHAFMLLVQDVMLHILKVFLGNRVSELNHLMLGGVARVCLSLLAGMLAISWEHLLNVFECF